MNPCVGDVAAVVDWYAPYEDWSPPETLKLLLKCFPSFIIAAEEYYDYWEIPALTPPIDDENAVIW